MGEKKYEGEVAWTRPKSNIQFRLNSGSKHDSFLDSILKFCRAVKIYI